MESLLFSCAKTGHSHIEDAQIVFIKPDTAEGDLLTFESEKDRQRLSSSRVDAGCVLRDDKLFTLHR
jgi:hypothetical protein